MPTLQCTGMSMPISDFWLPHEPALLQRALPTSCWELHPKALIPLLSPILQPMPVSFFQNKHTGVWSLLNTASSMLLIQDTITSFRDSGNSSLLVYLPASSTNSLLPVWLQSDPFKRKILSPQSLPETLHLM